MRTLRLKMSTPALTRAPLVRSRSSSLLSFSPCPPPSPPFILLLLSSFPSIFSVSYSLSSTSDALTDDRLFQESLLATDIQGELAPAIKIVFEQRKEREALDLLGKYVQSRAVAIETICDANYQVRLNQTVVSKAAKLCLKMSDIVIGFYSNHQRIVSNTRRGQGDAKYCGGVGQRRSEGCTQPSLEGDVISGNNPLPP